MEAVICNIEAEGGDNKDEQIEQVRETITPAENAQLKTVKQQTAK